MRAGAGGEAWEGVWSGSGGVLGAGEGAGTSWWCPGIVLGKIKISILKKNRSEFSTKISTQDFGN